MSDLRIDRGCTPLGTFGTMVMPNGVRLYTVERPWLGNLPSVSCIPAGVYECEPRNFFRGGYKAVEITEVPGRKHILFHIANFPRELEGCIGVCSRLGAIGGEWCGLASRNAFEVFMGFYDTRKFSLEIREVTAHVK